MKIREKLKTFNYFKLLLIVQIIFAIYIVGLTTVAYYIIFMQYLIIYQNYLTQIDIIEFISFIFFSTLVPFIMVYLAVWAPFLTLKKIRGYDLSYAELFFEITSTIYLLLITLLPEVGFYPLAITIISSPLLGIQ